MSFTKAQEFALVSKGLKSKAEFSLPKHCVPMRHKTKGVWSTCLEIFPNEQKVVIYALIANGFIVSTLNTSLETLVYVSWYHEKDANYIAHVNLDDG